MKYTDPDGQKFLPVSSRQYQNEGKNLVTSAGSTITFDRTVKNGITRYKFNSIGNFGCLFTSTVNIGNSYNQETKGKSYSEQSVYQLASVDKYFTFISKMGNKTGSNADFVTTTNQVRQLLSDMTGETFSLDVISGKSQISSKLEEIEKSKSGYYVIGKVKTASGVHFFNITGFKNGVMESFDVYNNEKVPPDPQKYKPSDLLQIYVIQQVKE